MPYTQVEVEEEDGKMGRKGRRNLKMSADLKKKKR